MSIPRPAISKGGVAHVRRDMIILLLAVIGIVEVGGWMVTREPDWFMHAAQALFRACANLLT